MKTSKQRRLWYIVILLSVCVYLAGGIYSIQSGQRALILRFGRVVDEVSKSGVHYHLPFPFERVVKVHVNEVQTLPIQPLVGNLPERFTGDENLIAIRALISYDVKRFKPLSVHDSGHSLSDPNRGGRPA